MRLETAALPGDRPQGELSCGAHLAEVVQKLALWAKEQRQHPAHVVVYAMTDNRRPNEVEPFDRLALGTIPV